MVKRENINKRSPMIISVESRLLGVAITVFVLILTLKLEFLQKNIIIFQLILSMPFLLVSMISNAKIVDSDSFKDYYAFNRVTNSVGVAFIFNALGLLINSYVAKTAGTIFFIILLFLFVCLFFIDLNKRKLYNELVVIIIVFLFGLLPAIL
ncbi:MAG: hypothetical protein PHH54_03135 [Candidatus Nanoarchaeia archaeon]|nr:hypothetical protein [Candidatus Nanoarchaeia archaeon]MDD5740955.1 hypothetical protein [Candidatus Nanoarchaeia archaeon]